jgi:hypothetical protein
MIRVENWTKEKRKTTLFQCHFIHQKSQMHSPGTEPEIPTREANLYPPTLSLGQCLFNTADINLGIFNIWVHAVAQLVEALLLFY